MRKNEERRKEGQRNSKRKNERPVEEKQVCSLTVLCIENGESTIVFPLNLKKYLAILDDQYGTRYW